MIYEMGIPVVELSDDKWHVNVMQKMPVGRDRDNVNPSYIGDVRVAIFNQFYTKLSPSDASLLSTQAAASHPKSLTEAVKANLAARFGEKYALEDPTDLGSKEEFVSQGGTVIQRNDLSPEMKRRLRKIKDASNPRSELLDTLIEKLGAAGQNGVSRRGPEDAIGPQSKIRPAAIHQEHLWIDSGRELRKI